jgi:DNA-binding transcriptional MocR family regulator
MDIHHLILTEMTERTPAGIAGAIGRLQRIGLLRPGMQFPTVRSLAHFLDLSPTTVATAWRMLRTAGIIQTDGRRGTTLRTPDRGVNRFWRVPAEAGDALLDLSSGTPDPHLLPPLTTALRRLTWSPSVSSYFDPAVVAGLESHLREDWPFDPQHLTIVNGAMDAIERLIRIRVHVGDRVVVEDPTFAPILDLLEQLGAEVIGVSVDERGMIPDRLADAMALHPVLLICQPRAHNPTGATWDIDRAEDLAEAVADTHTLIVENDHSAYVAGSKLRSLGSVFPDRVVHIRSFSKAYGPDLRLAAVGGARETIDNLVRMRQLGPGWSSRLLQMLLLYLLNDHSTTTIVARASSLYGERRRSIESALNDRGARTTAGRGFNIWMPVENEQACLIALAARGVAAAPGSPFWVSPRHRDDHIRITVSSLSEGVEELADVLADASRATMGAKA